MRLLLAATSLALLFATGCAGGGLPSELGASDDRAHERGLAFLEKASRENGAATLPSGVVFRTLASGNGESPVAADRVRVRYTGRLDDGKVFDSTANRGDATFPLTAVIRCWTEGIPHMRVGETAVLTCPSETAYGERRMGEMIAPGSVLQFEVELLDIVHVEPPREQP